MNKLSTGSYFFRGRFLMIMGLCLSVYFSYHAIAGQRSVLTLMQLQDQHVAVDQELAELSAKSDVLHKRVVMLRPDTLDADYVEELAVHYLGYRRPAALTVLYSGS